MERPGISIKNTTSTTLASRLRLERGLTHIDLHEALGYKPNRRYVGYVTGNTRAGRTFQNRLAEYFNIPVSNLFDEDGRAR